MEQVIVIDIVKLVHEMYLGIYNKNTCINDKTLLGKITVNMTVKIHSKIITKVLLSRETDTVFAMLKVLK